MSDQPEDTQLNGSSSKTDNKDNEEAEWKSYAGVPGDWETRQISIIGVVKRFISQLSYGQDLTRIAMPSEFLNPYSVLEYVALRYLTRFPILIEANAQAEPEYRLLHIIRWFLASLSGAKMYKKPYNPVVCETHTCFIEQGGTSPIHFIGEQVTHHPPVSAYHLSHEDTGVSVQGNISFGVKFWLNSVTVSTTGFVGVNLSNHNEEYKFNKALPDLYLKNVVFGTRRMRWQNTIEIVCPQSNCEAEITFDQSGNDETVRGKIKRDGEVVLTFDGSIESEVYYRGDDDDEEEILVSSEQTEKPRIHIPPQSDPYPSIKVWGDVSKHIVENNMTEADKAKQLVEEEQRTRTKQGEDEKKERKYFIKDETRNCWVYKEGSFNSTN